MIEEPKPQRKLPEIKYQWARNDKGEVLKITDITADNRNQRFTCINCHCQAREMSPVLRKDPKYRAYFRHKSKEHACSYESYLHFVCKHILKYRFEHSDKWIVKYYEEELCPSYQSTPFCKVYSCNGRPSPAYKEIDLKQLYDTCTIEKEYEGYRADVLLSNEKDAIEPLLIEVCYTSACTPKKVVSGIRIIEIDVNTEEDAEAELIESERIRFYGFKRQKTACGKLLTRVSFLNFPEPQGLQMRGDRVLCNEENREPNCVYEIRSSENIDLHLATALACRDIPGFKSCFVCAYRHSNCSAPVTGSFDGEKRFFRVEELDAQQQITVAMQMCRKKWPLLHENYLYNQWLANNEIQKSKGIPWVTWVSPSLKKPF